MTIAATPGGVLLRVHVQPGAATTALAGLHGDALKVRLAAPPVDGRANEALLAFLVEALDVPRRAVTLQRGAASRAKTVRVEGIDPETARARLGVG